jgi:transcriptional regulator with XRE-family HTH domain
MVTRIRQLLEYKQLTPTQFADLIGVGRPVMSHILSERNKPSLEVVQRMISAFPDISLPWLLSGTGEMLDTAAMAATPIELEKAVQPPTAPLEAPRVDSLPSVEAPLPALVAPLPTPVPVTPAVPRLAAPTDATPLPRVAEEAPKTAVPVTLPPLVVPAPALQAEPAP